MSSPCTEEGSMSASTPTCQVEESRSPGDSDTKGCTDCQRSMPHIKQAFNSEKYVLVMHVEHWVLGQSRKRGDINTVQKVRSFTDEFFRKVCSLRNSRGGVLAIHVQDMDENCGPSLDHFDEKVSKDLSNMIEDDSPYAYNYQRQWFHATDDTYIPQEAKYIVVIVKGSSAVSTKCFNTLVPFDGSKERPRAREVAKFLSDDMKYGKSNEKGNNKKFKEGERVDLIESRSVQFKSLSQRDLDNDLKDNPNLDSKSWCERLVFRLIEKLDFLQYLTAFTKLSNGGSFYLGIEEEKRKVPTTPKSPGLNKMNMKPESCRELNFTFQGKVLEKDRFSPSDDHSTSGRRSVSEHAKRKTDDRHRDRELPRGRAYQSRSRSRGKREEHSQERSREVSGRRGHDMRRRSSERDPRDKNSRRRPCERPSLKVPRTQSKRERPSTPRTSSENPTSTRRATTSGQLSAMSIRCPSSVQGTSRDHGTSAPPRCPGTPGSSRSPGTSGPPRSPVTPGTPGTPGHKDKEMKTGHNVVRGFEISNSERAGMKRLLQDRISENMMWLNSDGDCIKVCDILDAVDIIFHECSSDRGSKYVLEIRVKRVFQGLVFFTKEGPEAYKLGDKGQTVSIPICEWMKLLKRASKCASCIHNPADESPTE